MFPFDRAEEVLRAVRRVGCGRAGRGVAARGDQLRAGRAVRATGAGRASGSSCWSAAGAGTWPLVRRRSGRCVPSARPSTCSGRCRIRRCRRCSTAGRRRVAQLLPRRIRRRPQRRGHRGGARARRRGCPRRCRRSTCTRWAARSDGWDHHVVVQRTRRRLHLQPHRNMDRSVRGRDAHRRRPRRLGCARPRCRWQQLRQLRRRPTERVGAPPTAPRSTTGWRGSSASTTRRTCSAATRT